MSTSTSPPLPTSHPTPTSHPPSPPSRLPEWLRTTPPVTLGVIFLCCFLFGFVQVFLNVPLQSLTLSPLLIWYDGQVQRIVTGALFHVNFLHLAMNMMSTVAIGSRLEQQIGSFRLLSTILLSILITGSFYMIIVLILVFVFRLYSWMLHDAIGFSGVLFHLSVLECNLDTEFRSRYLFGVVKVPSYLYPWVA
jgi:membrane associated rhomboid family serine protease